MEGELSPLASIVAVKKKYGCYLYVDEAHSIGALGKTGQGICQHAGVDPADVDILMGTFTKSFGAVGGYIASSREIVNHLRLSSMGSVYSASISPPACMQIIQAIKVDLLTLCFISCSASSLFSFFQSKKKKNQHKK